MARWDRLHPKLIALGWTDAGEDLPGGLRSPHNAMLISNAIDDLDTLRRLIDSLERSVKSNREHQQMRYGAPNVNEVLADFEQAIALLTETADDDQGPDSA
jgi:hypothetical protein